MSEITDKMFNIQKDLIDQIKNPKILENHLDKCGNEGFQAKLNGNNEAFEFYERIYETIFNRIKSLTSEDILYPSNLKEYVNPTK